MSWGSPTATNITATKTKASAADLGKLYHHIVQALHANFRSDWRLDFRPGKPESQLQNAIEDSLEFHRFKLTFQHFEMSQKD